MVTNPNIIKQNELCYIVEKKNLIENGTKVKKLKNRGFKQE
jgi:hypothetical protein